jgi:hypothetical protein
MNPVAFIADRALTLTYEAKQFPHTSVTVENWLLLALRWAERHKCVELANSLRVNIHELFTLQEEK